MRMFCTPPLGGSLFISITAIVALASCGQPAGAVSRDYTIHTDTSSIAISGSVYSADLNQTRNIVEQGPGSLTSKYTGTIKAERELDSIGFLAGSLIDANVNGNWQPLPDASSGSAPADYGGRANFTVLVTVPVYFAGRDLAADVMSGPNTIDGGNQFSLASTNLTFTGGNIAYRASIGSPADSQTIVGQGGTLAGTGTIGLQSQGGLVYETLKFPVNATFTFGNASATINLTLTGEINARYLIPSSNGDYNKNGVVDAADYVVWRDSQGETGIGLGADGNGDNQITAADYGVWRSKFGQVVGSGADLVTDAVPEPTAAMLLVAGAAMLMRRRAR